MRLFHAVAIVSLITTPALAQRIVVSPGSPGNPYAAHENRQAARVDERRAARAAEHGNYQAAQHFQQHAQQNRAAAHAESHRSGPAIIIQP